MQGARPLSLKISILTILAQSLMDYQSEIPLFRLFFNGSYINRRICKKMPLFQETRALPQERAEE
jgi:hypothetical protein